MTPYAAAENTIEGVPWWVSLIVVPLVGVLIAYLRKLLKVEDATPTPTPKTPATAEQTGPRHYRSDAQDPPPPPPTADPQWELLEGMVGRLQTNHDALEVANRDLSAQAASLKAQVRAQQETIDELKATIRALTGRGPLPPYPHPQQ